MTGNKNVAVSHTLGRREHGVKSMDGSPIGEEMTLVIMSPGVSAKVVFVVNTFGKEKSSEGASAVTPASARREMGA